MKKQILNKLFNLTLLILAGTLIFVSCKEDEDDPIVVVLDGFYIKGESTAAPDFNDKAIMKVTRNEVTQENRNELMEIYIAIKAGDPGFNLVQVAGDVRTTYGPGSDFALVPEDSLDVEEPKDGLWRGSLAATDTKFTVPEDGLYHVMLDKEFMLIAISRVKWGAIGGATPGGWGESTPMTSTFDLNKMEFAVEDIVMLKNSWKFRYSNGWKIILDTEFDNGGGKLGIKVNTNLGNLEADKSTIDAQPVAGGKDVVNAIYAKYKITLTWEFGKAYVATADSTGPAPVLPEYPATMFMIGDAVGGWEWSTVDLPMVPVHSHPALFWKIVWMENTGGYKFCEKKEWGLDFGGAAGSSGLGTFDKGTDNITPPAIAGYYMVVVDLENNKIEVTEPSVFLIGDCVGGYDPSVPANIFTVDNANEKITVTKDLAAANLRMHVSSPLLTADWWQAEFMVLNGKIEFRGTGNDQTAVPMTAGTHTIDLNFKTGDGVIN